MVHGNSNTINLNLSLFSTYIHVFWATRIIHITAVFITRPADIYSLQHKSQNHGNVALELLLLSVGLPVAHALDVLQPCGLFYYP